MKVNKNKRNKSNKRKVKLGFNNRMIFSNRKKRQKKSLKITITFLIKIKLVIAMEIIMVIIISLNVKIDSTKITITITITITDNSAIIINSTEKTTINNLTIIKDKMVNITINSIIIEIIKEAITIIIAINLIKINLFIKTIIIKENKELNLKKQVEIKLYIKNKCKKIILDKIIIVLKVIILLLIKKKHF